MILKYFIISFLLCPLFAFAADQQLGASLYISPLSENPRNGNNFTVTVKTDSLSEPINAVKGVLTFNPDKLEIIGVSKIGSILNLFVQEPQFSNIDGTLKFQGGVPNPGFIGNGGVVLHVIFHAKASGITSLIWKEGEVLANDGKGSNILVNLQNLDFSVDEAFSSSGLNAPVQGPLWLQNTLIILNAVLLIIFLGVGFVFLIQALLRYHDRRLHHESRDYDDEEIHMHHHHDTEAEEGARPPILIRRNMPDRIIMIQNLRGEMAH